LFLDILHASFPYAAKSRRAAGSNPKIGTKPKNRRRRRFLAGRFLASPSLVAAMTTPFGFRLRQETTMEDPVENVQPYPVERHPAKVWPERQGEGNSPVSRKRGGGPLGG
jgi:hypothetical protein